MIQAWPRCRVCQRIHGLPRCEPVAWEYATQPTDGGYMADGEPMTAADIPESPPVANMANKPTKKRPGDPEKRRAYMREFMRRKRAAE